MGQFSKKDVISSRSSVALLTISAFVFIVLLGGCADEIYEPEQTGALKGRVISSQTYQALGGVHITTTPPTGAIVTDDSGAFTFTGIPEGEYALSANKVGYRQSKSSLQVSVSANDTTESVIMMTPDDDNNRAPRTPNTPAPGDGATEIQTTVELSWKCSDPDGDSLSYDIYLYANSEEPEKVKSGIGADSVQISGLQYHTRYSWQVVAIDENEESTYGPVWQFRTIDLPENSLVFASQRDGNYDLYSADPSDSTGSTIRLTATPNREWWPRHNPARDLIAFSSDALVESHIYTMEENGSNSYRITTKPIAGYHNYGIGFSWEPSGTRILYPHYETLYIVGIGGGSLTAVATAPPNRHFRETDWSPQGDRILAVTMGSSYYDAEIRLMNADGTGDTVLVENVKGAIGHPVFSPTGEEIAYFQDFSGYESAGTRKLNTHIVVLSLQTGDTTDVSVNKPAGTNDLYPRWSSDGTQILFVNQENDGSGSPSLWMVDSDGANRREILSNGTMGDLR